MWRLSSPSQTISPRRLLMRPKHCSDDSSSPMSRSMSIWRCRTRMRGWTAKQPAARDCLVLVPGGAGGPLSLRNPLQDPPWSAGCTSRRIQDTAFASNMTPTRCSFISVARKATAGRRSQSIETVGGGRSRKTDDKPRLAGRPTSACTSLDGRIGFLPSPGPRSGSNGSRSCAMVDRISPDDLWKRFPRLLC